MTATVQHVITLTAEDQPGIVDTLAQAVSHVEGNWLESRMARLAGQFAGIVLVAVPSSNSGDFLLALDALKSKGINATCETTASEQTQPQSLCTIELIGSDRPGIVMELSSLLKTLNVNVERLDTARESGSMSGTPLFSARALVNLPPGLTAEDLTANLEALSADLQVSMERQ